MRPKDHSQANWDEKRVTEAQRKYLWALWRKSGFPDEDFRTVLKNTFGKSNTSDLTQGEASRLIDELKRHGQPS